MISIWRALMISRTTLLKLVTKELLFHKSIRQLISSNRCRRWQWKQQKIIVCKIRNQLYQDISCKYLQCLSNHLLRSKSQCKISTRIRPPVSACLIITKEAKRFYSQIRLEVVLCPNVNYRHFMDLKVGLEQVAIDSNSLQLTWTWTCPFRLLGSISKTCFTLESQCSSTLLINLC